MIYKQDSLVRVFSNACSFKFERAKLELAIPTTQASIDLPPYSTRYMLQDMRAYWITTQNIEASAWNVVLASRTSSNSLMGQSSITANLSFTTLTYCPVKYISSKLLLLFVIKIIENKKRFSSELVEQENC